MIDKEKIEEFKKELDVLCSKYQLELVGNAMIKDGLIMSSISIIEKKDSSK